MNASRKLNQQVIRRCLQRAVQDSFAFQGPSSSSALTTDALEGLFTTLADRLGHLQDVRTDYPCDYLARCKATFTDHLIHELEARGYHSPAFDRLTRLRDAWDDGALDLPVVIESETHP